MHGKFEPEKYIASINHLIGFIGFSILFFINAGLALIRGPLLEVKGALFVRQNFNVKRLLILG